MADMYNGDILKPDALSPARIESMHSPRYHYKNMRVKEHRGNRLDLDLDVTTENLEIREVNRLSELTSLQVSSMNVNEP